MTSDVKTKAVTPDPILTRIEEMLQEFRPDLPRLLGALAELESHAVADDQRRALNELIAFFKEKTAEPEFWPSLDCRFPFFWIRFGRAWGVGGFKTPVQMGCAPASAVVEAFPDRRRGDAETRASVSGRSAPNAPSLGLRPV